MVKEHEIVPLVYEAKESMESADTLIGQYLPFIKSETSKFINRAPIEGQDDELSIAMIAFHEAIQAYDKEKGSFLGLASTLIRNRLIDFWRANKKHANVVSLDTPSNEEADSSLLDTIDDGKEYDEEYIRQDVTAEEIEELSKQMEDYGVSLEDVAEQSPKQDRTLEACQDVLEVAKKDTKLIDNFLETKRLPLKELEERSGVSRKTIERHRKYIVALFIIYSNGYEIIRGHLSQMKKGGA